MKKLLFLCTIWSSLNVNLSDGEVVTHNVGTIPKNFFSILKLHCIVDCDIKRVNVTHSKGGRVLVDGYYFIGNQRHLFCYGIPDGGTTTACKMSKKTGLSNPQIEMLAREASYNVILEIECSKLQNISQIPNFKPMKYDVGNMKLNQILYFLIDCIGDCKIKDVTILFDGGGNVHLVGYYGNGKQLTFCNGSSPSDTTNACVMTKKTGLTNAAVSISAQGTTNNAILTVEGGNLLKISKLKETHEYHVGNMRLNQILYFLIDCIVTDCNIKEVGVSFNHGIYSNVHVMGYYDNGGPQLTFCEGSSPRTRATICVMSNKRGLSNAAISISAKGTTDNVYLIVKGSNVRKIRKLPEGIQTLTTNVGTLDPKKKALYVFKCVGPCRFLHVYVTFKVGGNVVPSGYYGNAKFCTKKRDSITPGYQSCQVKNDLQGQGLINPEVFLKAKMRSENVVLTVTGYNLLEVKSKPI